jgi:hypothetical protein
MTNGRFNTSKSRDVLQKIGVMYTHSPKLPKKKLFVINKKIQKKGTRHGRLGVDPWPAGNRWSPASRGPTLGLSDSFPFF